MKMNESKQNRVILSLKMKQKANPVPEELYTILHNFCAICNYYIFYIADNS